MNENIKKQVINTLMNLIKIDTKHDIFTKDFANALEKEHRKLLLSRN